MTFQQCFVCKTKLYLGLTNGCTSRMAYITMSKKQTDAKHVGGVQLYFLPNYLRPAYLIMQQHEILHIDFVTKI